MICRVAEFLDLPPLADTWDGIDSVIPILERIKDDGAVILLKFDGERKGTDDEPGYTTVITGSALEDDFIRIDTNTLEDGLVFALGSYAERVWGLKLQ